MRRGGRALRNRRVPSNDKLPLFRVRENSPRTLGDITLMLLPCTPFHSRYWNKTLYSVSRGRSSAYGLTNGPLCNSIELLRPS